MATPPDDDAKPVEREPATDVGMVPHDEATAKPTGPPRRITRSIPPPIPTGDRVRRPTQSRPQLDAINLVDAARARLSQVTDAVRAAELAKQVETATGDPALAAHLTYELGELCERQLADEERALVAYRKACTLDPTFLPATWALRRVLYRRGLWPELVKLIDLELARAISDDERIEGLLERAMVSVHANMDADARRALDEVLRLAPHQQVALLELERLVARGGDRAALVDVWTRLADTAADPERKIAYWLEVAAEVAERDPTRAGIALDRASELAEGRPPAAARRFAERIARRRLQLAEAQGGEPVARAIEALAHTMSAVPGESPGHVIARRRELVSLRRRQAQAARAESPARAWDYLQQGLALAPEEPVLVVDLLELAGELDRRDELPQLVRVWQAVEGDAARAAMLSLWCAQAHLSPDRRERIRSLLTALESTLPGFVLLTSSAECEALADPSRSRAQLDLANAYTTGAHAARAGTWLGPRATAHPDANAAAAMYIQAAYLLAYHVATPAALEAAREALGQALATTPAHPAVLEAATELDLTTGRYDEALRRMRDLAKGTTDRRVFIERALRIAYGQRVSEVVLELERELVTLAPGEPALAWRLDATLAGLGEAADGERAELLTKLAADERDPTRRNTALFHAARLRERTGALDAAIDLYRQLAAHWPHDELARDALTDLLRAKERWPELVELRLGEARAASDPPARRRALREAAWVLETCQNDPSRAASVYDQWLQWLPGDRTALEGIARCRAALGEHAAEAIAREAIAELDQTAEAQWLYARSLETAQRYDEAAKQYRGLVERDEMSVATASATLALGDLAARGADLRLRIEAAEALAKRTTDPRLGAALFEDSGWMSAVALEELDPAAESFEAALALEPARQGALLGAALVAAAQSDRERLGELFAQLAETVSMPEAAAALYLRAAALADATGNDGLANERVQSARLADPENTNALFVAAESQPPQPASPEDPFAAVDRLVARASLLDLRAAMTEDPLARITWDLDRADLLELAGQVREASALVTSVLAVHSNNWRALSSVRRIARGAALDTVWAQASYELAERVNDREAKLKLLRDVVSVYDQPSGEGNVELALAAYRRILAVDPGAAEFDRVVALLRERQDARKLIVALSERLVWLVATRSNDDELMIVILLERSTLLERIGMTARAVADLDAVLARAPKHGEALRLRADLALAAKDVDGAIALWWRYLAAEVSDAGRAEIEERLAQYLQKTGKPSPRAQMPQQQWEPESTTQVGGADPFGGTTAVVDLSDMQEEERRVARVSGRFDVPDIEVTATNTTTETSASGGTSSTAAQTAFELPASSLGVNTAVGEAVGALDVVSPASAPALQPPILELAKLFPIAQVSQDPEPVLELGALEFPDEISLSPDDSAVVMLSYDDLQPRKLGDGADVVLAALEREIELAADTATKVELRLECGRLAEMLGDPERARTHYDAALLGDRRATAALRGLRRISRANGDTLEVTRLVEAEIAVASPRERDALMRYRIELLMASGEQDIARVAVGELLDTAPRDIPALLAHLELVFLDARADEFGKALEELAEAVTDPGLRGAAQAARGVFAARHGDAAGAARWAAAAAEMDPGSPATQLAAIRQAVAHGEREAANNALYELACHVEGEDPITAAALALRALASPTGANREAMAEAAQLASRTAARDPVVARIATDVALAAGDQVLAGRAFARWARCKCPPAERAYAAARAAELDPELGRLWSQVLELDPGDDFAAAMLRAAHVDAGEPRAALEVDLQLAHETDREAPLVRAAFEQIEQGLVEAAIERLTAARAKRPHSPAIGEALAEAFASAGRWQDLAALRGEQAAESGMLARDVARWRSALAFEKAALEATGSREDCERAMAAALDAWDVVLEEHPHAPIAHAASITLASTLEDPAVLIDVLARAQAAERSPWAAATLALRRSRLLARVDARQAQDVARDSGPGLDDPRRTLAVMMFAAQRGDLGEAASALEERATLLDNSRTGTEPSVEAETLRLRAAQLALDAGDVPRATLLLARVDRLLPGIVEDLIDAARRRTNSGPHAGTRSRVRADSFARIMHDADDAAARGAKPIALELYQRALEIRPTDPLAAAPLVRIATAMRNPAPIAALALEQLRTAEAFGDPLAKADAYELLARVERDLKRDKAAAQISLESAVRSDPSRLDLLCRLASELAVGKRNNELLRLRDKEIEHVKQSGDAGAGDLVALLADAATLAARDRRPDAQIAPMYRAVLELAPHDRRALHQLDSILRRTGFSDELAALEERIAGYAGDPRTKAAFSMRAGDTLSILGRAADAVQRYARAADAMPGYTLALDAWHRTALANELWLEVAESAMRKARLGGDAKSVAGLYHFAGVALAEKAKAPEPAIAAFRHALDADPGHSEAFAHLRTLFENRGMGDELAALLRARLAAETDRGAQIELNRSLAEHFLSAGDRDKALQYYRALLKLDPADVRAHAAIADIASDQRNWEQAADAVIARIPLEKDSRILASLHYRLGTLYAEHDVGKAIEELRRAAALRPDPTTLGRLVDLAIGQAQWQLALEACDQLVTTQREPDKLALHLHRAATIFARGLGDMERADRMLQLAFEAAPTSTEGLRLLVKFFSDAGDAAGLRAWLGRVVDAMRARIAQNVIDGPAYRIIARAIAARGEGAADPALPIARAAAELAEALGSGGDPERSWLAEPSHGDLALLAGARGDDLLCADGMQPELRHVLRLLGPAIAKHVGTDLGAFGVGRKERLHPPDPTLAIAREIALSLGFKDVDVYVSSRLPYVMIAEPTNPVSLVLGSAIAGGDARAIRFAAGAALKLAQMSLAIPARLSVDDLGVVGTAALRLFQPDFSAPGVRGDEANALVPKLRRYASNSVVDEARRYALAVRTFSAASLSRDIKIIGLRAGLAASGSLLPGLAIVAASVGADLPSVLADPLAQGLVSFALSDARLIGANHTYG